MNQNTINYKIIALSAIIIVILGLIFYHNSNRNEISENENLGTFTDPEMAYIETQKALNLFSVTINTGYGSFRYFNEYENSKNLIFK